MTFSIAPIRTVAIAQQRHETEPSEGCAVSQTAILVIRALGLMLMAAGVACIMASAYAPGTALLVAGVALLALGFILNKKEQQPLPLDESVSPLLDISKTRDKEHLFAQIDSSKTRQCSAVNKLKNRKDFLSAGLETPAPVIGKSDFVSDEMVRHLMTNKKNLALGIKYVPGDQITNMEGALHTFVTPVGPIMMSGDYQWLGRLVGSSFNDNEVREMILSASIHPDFEFDNVIMPLVTINDKPTEGVSMNGDKMDAQLRSVNRSTVDSRYLYDLKLLQHMVYHLTKAHRLPALNEIPQKNILTQGGAKTYLEDLIQNKSGDRLQEEIVGKFVMVHVQGSTFTISLEVLLNLYIEAVRNEFKALNKHTPQGYVYTICPPSIFARAIGDATLLNRLQALAFKYLLSQETIFSNLEVLAFNDYSDQYMVDLYQSIFEGYAEVRSLASLYRDQKYVGPKGKALVVHNNSDGFGQNIEFEGVSSMDGMIGSFSNAAALLKRDRPDLVSCVV